MEGLDIAVTAQRRGIASEDAGAAMQAQGLDVFPQQAAAFDTVFDEQRRAATTRQRLHANSAGTGEEIEDTRAVQHIRMGVAQDIEQAFARPVDGRPDRVALGCGQNTATKLTADDPHRVSCLPVCRNRRGGRSRQAGRPVACHLQVSHQTACRQRVCSTATACRLVAVSALA